MSTAIICVGKMKEKPYREMADEYLKRLRRFGGYEEIEIPDLPEPSGGGSPALEERIRLREGEGILKAIHPGDRVIALTIGGREYDSPGLAEHLRTVRERYGGRVALVIGGSLGIGKNVLDRADEEISMGRMTFPHQLARVMLLEQLYRAEKISAGERYHK